MVYKFHLGKAIPTVKDKFQWLVGEQPIGRSSGTSREEELVEWVRLSLGDVVDYEDVLGPDSDESSDEENEALFELVATQVGKEKSVLFVGAEKEVVEFLIAF